MLGSPILYLKGMRLLMFQLSGFYYILNRIRDPAIIQGIFLNEGILEPLGV